MKFRNSKNNILFEGVIDELKSLDKDVTISIDKVDNNKIDNKIDIKIDNKIDIKI